jgi:hypothetical protein
MLIGAAEAWDPTGLEVVRLAEDAIERARRLA